MPYRESPPIRDEVLVIKPGNWPIGVGLFVIFAFPLIWKAVETPSLTLTLLALAFGLPLFAVTLWLFSQRIRITLTSAELALDEFSLGPWGRRSAKVPRPEEVTIKVRERINGGAWEWVVTSNDGELTGVRADAGQAAQDLDRVRSFLEDHDIEVRDAF